MVCIEKYKLNHRLMHEEMLTSTFVFHCCRGFLNRLSLLSKMLLRVITASRYGNIRFDPRSCKYIQIHGFNGNICIQDRCVTKTSEVKN